MKKILLLGLILSQLYGDNFHWNHTLLPEFRTGVRPFIWNECQGMSFLIEGGRQIFRLNGTYGRAFTENALGKVSLEYLSQRLGLVYLSGREHKWVAQGAVGIACRVPLGELALNYSHAPKRKLFSHVIPLQNAICDKKIAGSHGFGLSLASSFFPWTSAKITGGCIYDYVFFKRHYEKNKVIQGLGFRLQFEQSLNPFAEFHASISLQAPFIFYEVSLVSQLWAFGKSLDVAIYGQRVHGLRTIPNSSRIGIEVSFGLEEFNSKDSTSSCSTLHQWLSSPAIYLPEVLVVKDEKTRSFCLAPLAQGTLGIVQVEPGFFTFNTDAYFSGSSPLVYCSSPLPGNLKLNPITGKITGMIDASLKGAYAVAIKATNYSGEAIQTVVFNFNN